MTAIRKFVSLLVALLLLMAVPAFADFSVYPNGGIIVDLIPEDDVVIFEDGAGLNWAFYGIEDYGIGDLVACIFWDAGTETIFDDEIINVQYIGYVEQFE